MNMRQIRNKVLLYHKMFKDLWKYMRNRSRNKNKSILWYDTLTYITRALIEKTHETSIWLNSTTVIPSMDRIETDRLTLQTTWYMITSSNGNIFRGSGSLCGKPPVAGGFPSQRPVTRGFDVFFDLPMNKGWSKQSIRRWFEIATCSL